MLDAVLHTMYMKRSEVGDIWSNDVDCTDSHWHTSHVPADSVVSTDSHSAGRVTVWLLVSWFVSLWLVPSYQRSTIGRRAFPIAGAHVWNALPSGVTSAPSLAVFGRRLKTELFRRCYNAVWLLFFSLL